jgi:hypothetical protein
MLHPVAMGALVVLIVNDHLLKVVAPSPVTGILSGVAGMIVMPLVIVSLVEVTCSAVGRWRRPGARVLMLACLMTAIGYAAVELVPGAADAYRYAWGAMQWPLRALGALADGGGVPSIVPVTAVSDPVDLLAIGALAVPVVIGRARAAASRVRHPGAASGS